MWYECHCQNTNCHNRGKTHSIVKSCVDSYVGRVRYTKQRITELRTELPKALNSSGRRSELLFITIVRQKQSMHSKRQWSSEIRGYNNSLSWRLVCSLANVILC